MDEVGISRLVEDAIIHSRSRHGKIVSLDLAFVVFECKVLDPVGSIGECMVWRRR